MLLKDRIKEKCRELGISMSKVETDLGFARGYLSKLDSSTPNAKKMQALADYFGVSVDHLLSGDVSEDTPTYYLNDDARELAEFLFHNPEYKVLFDASRKVKKEDIEFVKQMIERTNTGS